MSNLKEIRAKLKAAYKEAKGQHDYFDQAGTAKIGLEAVAIIDDLAAGLRSIGLVMDNSRGVDGWHLNGDIAPWDELFPEDDPRDLLRKHNLLEDSCETTKEER